METTITIPTLAKGEFYAGIIIKDGKPHHHVILLPGEDGCSQGHDCPATYPGDRFVGIATTVIFVIWVVCIAVGVPL